MLVHVLIFWPLFYWHLFKIPGTSFRKRDKASIIVQQKKDSSRTSPLPGRFTYVLELTSCSLFGKKTMQAWRSFSGRHQQQAGQKEVILGQADTECVPLVKSGSITAFLGQKQVKKLSWGQYRTEVFWCECECDRALCLSVRQTGPLSRGYL